MYYVTGFTPFTRCRSVVSQLGALYTETPQGHEYLGVYLGILACGGVFVAISRCLAEGASKVFQIICFTNFQFPNRGSFFSIWNTWHHGFALIAAASIGALNSIDSVGFTWFYCSGTPTVGSSLCSPRNFHCSGKCRGWAAAFRKLGLAQLRSKGKVSITPFRVEPCSTVQCTYRFYDTGWRPAPSTRYGSPPG